MMKKFALATASLVALLVAAPGQAAALFAPTPGGSLVTDHDAGNPVNLGNVFTITNTSRVTSLGFYTPTNLVGGGQTVSLYDSVGALLASTFVAASTTTPGQYVYQALAQSVQLAAGQQYTVSTFVGQNAWGYGDVTTTGATFNYNAYAYGATPTFPTQTAGASGPAYLGPNLLLAAVPEPATWAMMIGGFGLVGGAMRRRTAVSARIRFA